LRQSPFSSDSVIAIEPNSGVFVLPRTTKPASLMRRTTAASAAGTWSANALHEKVVRMPAVSFRSLIGIGTPWNGPSRGGSGSSTTVTYAFSCGSRRSMRPR